MKMFLNFAVLSISLLLATESFAQTAPPAYGSAPAAPGQASSAQGSTTTAPANLVGAWSPYQIVDEETKLLFNKVFEQQAGATYMPYCVSKQVAAGTNYRFFCFSNTTTNPPKAGNAVIDIQVDPDGKVKDRKIEDFPLQRLAGGWTEFKPLDDKAKEIFNTTLGKVQGLTSVPLCVSTQVVSGTNYRFLCYSNSTTNPPKSGNTLGVVYADLQGNKKITEFKAFATSDLSKLLQGDRPQDGASSTPSGNRVQFQGSSPQRSVAPAPIGTPAPNQQM